MEKRGAEEGKRRIGGKKGRKEKGRGEKEERGKRGNTWRAAVTSGELCLAAAVGGGGSSRKQVSFDVSRKMKSI